MRAVDIIINKRDGLELSREEINFFITKYTQGEIPDYQAAAWLMAVLLKGMNQREITDLTLAMAYSGETIDLNGVVPIAVDKHSTGGVGDKTTLVVEPVVAACGLAVGKMSGRGLGFSGGTLDKLESIPGFRTNLSTEEFIQQLRSIGLVLTGQSADLAPADGKLYALRDVTGTVQSIPLIASSVMSKKIAAGAQAIVLDVKVGLGAFMSNLAEARLLAEMMVSIADLSGRKAIAVLSDMNQPLGCAVGNALEVREAIDTLHGGGPVDFREHCLEIATHMLVLGQVEADPVKARHLAQQALQDGSAWHTFTRLVKAQGGEVGYIETPSLLPAAPVRLWVESPRQGYLQQVHAREIGEIAVFLGAGRAKKGDKIDYSVGIEVLCKVGQKVEHGEPLFVIHANHQAEAEEASTRLFRSLLWSELPVSPLPLFYGIVPG